MYPFNKLDLCKIKHFQCRKCLNILYTFYKLQKLVKLISYIMLHHLENASIKRTSKFYRIFRKRDNFYTHRRHVRVISIYVKIRFQQKPRSIFVPHNEVFAPVASSRRVTTVNSTRVAILSEA